MLWDPLWDAPKSLVISIPSKKEPKIGRWHFNSFPLSSHPLAGCFPKNFDSSAAKYIVLEAPKPSNGACTEPALIKSLGHPAEETGWGRAGRAGEGLEGAMSELEGEKPESGNRNGGRRQAD